MRTLHKVHPLRQSHIGRPIDYRFRWRLWGTHVTRPVACRLMAEGQ